MRSGPKSSRKRIPQKNNRPEIQAKTNPRIHLTTIARKLSFRSCGPEPGQNLSRNGTDRTIRASLILRAATNLAGRRQCTKCCGRLLLYAASSKTMSYVLRTVSLVSLASGAAAFAWKADPHLFWNAILHFTTPNTSKEFRPHVCHQFF